MKYTIKKNAKKKTVELHMKCELVSGSRYASKQKYRTEDACRILEENGITVGACLQKATVSNWYEDRTEGTWVFEMKGASAPKTAPKATTTTTAQK